MNPIKHLLFAVCVCWFVVLLPIERVIGAPLPEAALEHIEKGRASAAAAKWNQAIAEFGSAHWLAPDAAEPLFNLALAYDREGKSPLLALVWFNAWLTAVAPDAPQTDRVRARMAELESRIEQTLSDLAVTIETAIPALERQLADVDYMDDNGKQDTMDRVRFGLASTLLARGEYERAIGTFGQLRNKHSIYTQLDFTLAVRRLAEERAELGMFAEAMEIMKLIPPDADWGERARGENLSSTKHAITESLADSGKFDEAFTLLNSIDISFPPLASSYAYYRFDGAKKIAKGQITAGDKEGARETLQLASTALNERLQDPKKSDERKAEYLADLVALFVATENMTEAKKLLGRIEALWKKQGLTERQKFSVYDDTIPTSLIIAKSSLGQFESALDDIDTTIDTKDQVSAFRVILDHALKQGDVDSALEVASRSPEEERSYNLYRVLEAMIESGDIEGGLKLDDRLEPAHASQLLLRAARAYAELGNALRAEELLVRFQEMSDQTDNAYTLVWRLTKRAVVYALLNSSPEATKVLKQAVKVAESIEALNVRIGASLLVADALSEIGESLLTANQLESVERDLIAADASEEPGFDVSWYWRLVADHYRRLNKAELSQRATANGFKSYWKASKKSRLKNWLELANRMKRPYRSDKPDLSNPVVDLNSYLDSIINNAEYDFAGYRLTETASAADFFASAYIDIQITALEQQNSYRQSFPSMRNWTASQPAKVSGTSAGGGHALSGADANAVVKPAKRTATSNSSSAGIGIRMKALRNTNVRSGPSTNHSILGTLVAGTTVTVTSIVEGGQWYRIDYLNGKDGYVYGSLFGNP